jgi:cell division protein FtsI/penicillin-binding protein 2
MPTRIKLLQVFFLLWFFLLVGRLFYWQVVKAQEMSDLALAQYGSSNELAAPRGRIDHLDGYPMAMDTEGHLLYLNPQVFKVSHQVKEDLISLLPSSDSARKALDFNSDTNLSWLAVSHGVMPETKKQLELMNLKGIGFESEPVRSYLTASSSAYITGFVGKDSDGHPQGYFGLEGFYDRVLRGKPGLLIEEVDALGRPIVISGTKKIPPLSGQNLETSIDRTVQYVAFKKLEEGLAKYQAASGTVSIMETKTGKILAMVSLPSYDPGKYQLFDESVYSNPIVSDGYEPGSTFKTVIMAAGLDSKAVSPNTGCDACSGPQVISEAVVRNYNDKYYPGTSMTDVILHSDNIGMIFVSRKLGKSRMLSYLREFGFGKLTGIDLQEEDTPEIKPDDQWYDVDWATAAFGQGIAVTRIQMLTAVNAIANRGILVSPYIVTSIKSGSTEEKKISPPEPRRVISEAAAEMTKNMMTNGVEKGEVRYYRVPGYTVAGKTGTAQVPIAGHYDPDKVIASFVGFAPAEDPKFTMLVTLREPKTSPWGSTTAAPLWFNIARDLFRYYRIPPLSH